MNETAHEHGSRNLHPREADGASSSGIDSLVCMANP